MNGSGINRGAMAERWCATLQDMQLYIAMAIPCYRVEEHLLNTQAVDVL